MDDEALHAAADTLTAVPSGLGPEPVFVQRLIGPRRGPRPRRLPGRDDAQARRSGRTGEFRVVAHDLIDTEP